MPFGDHVGMVFFGAARCATRRSRALAWPFLDFSQPLSGRSRGRGVLPQPGNLSRFTEWRDGDTDDQPLLPAIIPPVCPSADRIRLLWQQMRPVILEHFHSAAAAPDPAAVFAKAHKFYEYSAYHSLSIEGFQVTSELIVKISAGGDSDDPAMREENNRLAA